MATDDCITSSSFTYLLGVTTASNIIIETCKAIYRVLQKDVLPGRKSVQEWLDIAAEFETQWNFPNCVGAIDGKQIAIRV